MTKKEKIMIALMSIIVILLTLIILSNSARGTAPSAGLTYNSIDSTNDIAYLAAYKPEYFMELTAAQLFAPNARNNFRGIGINSDSVEDLAYRSTICIYHTQSNERDVYVKIANVVDIEFPGKLTVYKYRSIMKYSGNLAVGDRTNFTDGSIGEIVLVKDSKYRVRYYKAEIDISTLTTTEKRDIATMAVLMNKANSYNPKPNTTNTDIENAVNYYWQQKIMPIIKKSGKLDSQFDVTNYSKDDDNSYVIGIDRIKEKITEAINEAQDICYETIKKVGTTNNPEIVYVGTKAYIGPLKITYNGGSTALSVKADSETMTAGWTTKKTDGSFNSTKTGNITANQEFYAVVDKSKVENKTKVTVTAKLNYSNSYAARFVLSKNMLNNGQNLMYFVGSGGTDTNEDTVKWELSQSNDVSLRIYKKDSSGKMFKKSGIKFEIYEQDGTTLVGTLETTTTGKTGTLEGLEKGKKYILKENYNNWYGYGHRFITNPEIVSGEGTIKKINDSKHSIEIVLNSNVVIGINNTQILGDLTINKIGDPELDGIVIGDKDNNGGSGDEEDEAEDIYTGETSGETNIENTEKIDSDDVKLQGVKFTLQRNGYYLRLYEAPSEQGFIEELEITAEDGLDLLTYAGSQRTFKTTNQNEATKFITNSDGQIIIRNLAIYSNAQDENGNSKKYEYTVKEVENDLYGYKAMHMVDNDITLVGGETGSVTKDTTSKSVKFKIGNSNTIVVTMRNPQYLGELEVTKKDQTGKLQKDVEFVLYKAVSNDTGYIRLVNKQTNKWVESISTEIDIADYEIIYVSEDKNQATRFITDRNGKISIKGLEVYSGKATSGIGTKYNYYLEELTNNNYGNKNTFITNVTSTNADLLEYEERMIDFKLNDLNITDIEVENSTDLVKLIINKVDKDNNDKVIEGAEFTIYQSGTGANGWIKLEGVEGTVVTPNEGLDITKYKVLYVSTSDEATRFVTNSSGKIVINNLERYCGKNSEFIYYIREKSNTAYGYKGMIMNDEDVVVDGCEIIPVEADGTNVSESYRQVKIKPTSDEVNVTIENNEELAKLEILKVNEKDEPIEGVEFAIYQTGFARWMRLNEKSVTNPITTSNAGVNITEYNVTYVDTYEEATKFLTNADGKIVINNLEIYSGKDQKYAYTICETQNNAYGYKNVEISEDDVSVTGGELQNVDTKNKYIKIKITENIMQLKIRNSKSLGNLEIIKTEEGNSQNALENVEFIIKAEKEQYLQLYTVSGTGEKALESIKGNVIISENNVPVDSKYALKYVENEKEATVFITNSQGRVLIHNLEVYKQENEKIKYEIYEKYNHNYGYGSIENINEAKAEVEITSGETAKVNFTNKSELGNLEIIKVDKDYENIVLPNVEFVIQAKSGSSNTYSYLALQQAEGLVKEAPSLVTINKNNTITADGTEYALEYIKTTEGYTSELKDKITVFKTNEEGKIYIENLEVYDRETGEKYRYNVVEISNPNYGYELDLETGNQKNIVIGGEGSEGNTEKITINNEQEVTKISGYVWIENKDLRKSNTYNLVYLDSTEDIKLKDLYMTNENGKLVRNETAEIPVIIKLIDSNGTIIKQQPDKFIYQGKNDKAVEDAGKYTFEGVKIYKEDKNGEKILDSNGNKMLEEYKVVFEYDGFYYSTITPKTELENGSKVRENENDRTKLNEKFGTVESGDKIVSADKTVENGVIYDEVKNHYSALLGFVEANLTMVKAESIISISDLLNDMKQNNNGIVEGIDNINMGLALREQPILWIDSNIDNVEVTVNARGEESKYTYEYEKGDRVYLNEEYYYDQETGIHKATATSQDGNKNLTDRLEQENELSTYRQNFLESDINAAALDSNDDINMSASIIYKIAVNNSSGKLTSVVHEIKNYFDARCIVEEIGLSMNANNEIGDIIYRNNSIGENQDGFYFENDVDVTYIDGSNTEEFKYNSLTIPLGGNGMRLKALETGKIYIKYRISGDAIEDLINKKTVYNNATEITKYSTYYEENVGTGLVKDENGKDIKVDIITENQKVLENKKRTGEIYAGINLGSRPDNIKLKLIKDEKENVLKFDNSEYENDSTAAQSIILEAKGTRTISGTVFEDLAITDANNEKNGDGKFDSSKEKGISNVKVELYTIAENGAIKERALYADNVTPIVAEADTNGKYVLGGYKDESGIEYGILPGRYIILYTYGSYINDAQEAKQTYAVDQNSNNYKIVDAMNYKSTIIPAESGLQEEFRNKIAKEETNEVWFTRKNDRIYSSAIDNLRLRAEYNAAPEENSITYDKLRGNGMAVLTEEGRQIYQKAEISQMTAQTLPMNVNIHYTAGNSIQVVRLDENGQIIYENEELKPELEAVNFGIVERPDIDIKIDKKITEIEVIAQTGASIIPKSNPQKSTVQYITNVDNRITAQIESKLLQGSKLNLEYTITVENNSNVDYLCESYYYFAEPNNQYKNTPTAKTVVDYLDATMELDTSKAENDIWKLETAENLKNNGYIDEDVYNALISKGENKKYYSYTTDAFENVELGGNSKSEKMYVTRTLSAAEDITEINRVEVIEVAGRRPITGAIPGNFVPDENDAFLSNSGTNMQGINIPGTNMLGTNILRTNMVGKTYWQELDYYIAPANVIPPTGISVDYRMYIIATVVMLVIVTVGIVIIKKKVIK